MNLKSLLPLIIGVLGPVVTAAIPAVQPVIAQNFWLSTVFSVGLVLWNHFVTPVTAAPASAVKL